MVAVAQAGGGKAHIGGFQVIFHGIVGAHGNGALPALVVQVGGEPQIRHLAAVEGLELGPVIDGQHGVQVLAVGLVVAFGIAGGQTAEGRRGVAGLGHQGQAGLVPIPRRQDGPQQGIGLGQQTAVYVEAPILRHLVGHSHPVGGQHHARGLGQVLQVKAFVLGQAGGGRRHRGGLGGFGGGGNGGGLRRRPQRERHGHHHDKGHHDHHNTQQKHPPLVPDRLLGRPAGRLGRRFRQGCAAVGAEFLARPGTGGPALGTAFHDRCSFLCPVAQVSAMATRYL